MQKSIRTRRSGHRMPHCCEGNWVDFRFRRPHFAAFFFLSAVVFISSSGTFFPLLYRFTKWAKISRKKKNNHEWTIRLCFLVVFLVLCLHTQYHRGFFHRKIHRLSQIAVGSCCCCSCGTLRDVVVAVQFAAKLTIPVAISIVQTGCLDGILHFITLLSGVC